MNLATPRRRFFLVAAAVLLAGNAIQPLIATLFGAIINRFDLFCTGATGACGVAKSLQYSLLPDLLVAFAVAGLLVLLRPVTSWVLRPLRDLVPVVEQVGPQNLGHRIEPVGGSRDELAALSRAINDMMDRIMAGYEGQRRFAANASHELRTPLAVQRILIEVGMAQPLTPEQTALLTTQLLQTNQRNERLIEGLLVLSEVDQGLAARLPVRLDEIAAAVVAAHHGPAAATAIQLTTDLKPRTVNGEQVLLERLITNLVQNAVKYNHPHGTIHVAVGQTPAVTVTNTGQPVPPEAVTELFEPFKRLTGDRIDHSGGAGLGLAIARSITRAHGGTITATALGTGGLRIEVRLPEPTP
ncbi:sensor histidine kinase [Dactylosporangium sp. CA-092794]|uniref:sensor histidine kinase n=1 Tax=Dactylosporangium sp. CA-092794 TaxID=3239929 RepID=UPI003D933BB3